MAIEAKVDPVTLRFLQWLSELDVDGLRTVLTTHPLGRSPEKAAATKEVNGAGLPASFQSALDRGLTNVRVALSHLFSAEFPDSKVKFTNLASFAASALRRRDAISCASFDYAVAPFRAAGYDFDASVDESENQA